MKVFVTGATGFIGTALVPELIGAGHTVLGMTRSSEGAERLSRAGAEPHQGTIEDLESIKAGASQADAVIHLAFNHDFSKMQQNCEDDRLAIEAIGEVLAGSGKPFIGTSGVLGVTSNPNLPVDEDDVKELGDFPRVSEEATLATVDKGVRGIVMRLSQIHDTQKAGLVSFMIMLGFQKGKLAYVGEGGQRWAAAHVSDTARLYRLALEKGEAGSKWHAVGEGGVTSKDIVETLSRRLNLPAVSISAEEARAEYGFLGHFMALDSPTSNTKTRERLGWNPTGPTLLEDLSQFVVPK